MVSKKFIERLLNSEEGTKLDFKVKVELDLESLKKELCKDVCAIANSRGGRGYIVIGIEDKNKRIVGMKNNLVEETIQQIVSSRCEPPIPIKYDTIMYDDKKIGVITIYDGGQKPYQLKEQGNFYIRRGSTNDVMRKQEILSAFQENISFNLELCPIIRSSISNLNIDLLKKYYNAKGIELNERNKIFLLESSGIITNVRSINKYYPTLGGLLVFSDSNSTYFPHNKVKIINGLSKNTFYVEGNLQQMIDESELLIKRIVPKDYPVHAIVEAIKNAILYRDYTLYDRVIQVIISNKNIVIISPGTLLNNNSNNVLDYANRNMWIYEKLLTLNSDRESTSNGSGFNIIKKSFSNNKKVYLINDLENNSFKVILPGIQKNNDNIK